MDDTVLFLGLGAFSFVAVHAVGYALRDVLSLTQIHEQPQKQICAISQETEDALDANSLAVLADSHDRPTREAAIRILADRFVRDASLVTSLTRDMYSPNASTRMSANTLLKLLEKNASDTGTIAFLSQATRASLPTFHSIAIPAAATAAVREREESFEEQEVRRRRREAVVFHEGGGAVRREDIIQRDGNGVTGSRSDAETSMVEDALREITAGTG